jgi:hypothetical protein
MNDDIDSNSISSNRFIDCDFTGCKNEATETIDVKKDAFHTDKLYLCRKCKEKW